MSLQSENDPFNNLSLIKTTLICLGMFYLGLIIAILFQFYKLCSQTIKLKIIYGFFSSLCLALVARALTIGLIILYSDEILDEKNNLSNIIFILIIIPDMINCCVFIFLIWLFFNTYIISHISLARDIDLFKDEGAQLLKTRTNKFLYTVIAIYSLFFTCITALSLTKIINGEIMPIINGCFNLVTPFLAVIYYIYLTFQYSGSPYSTEEAKKQVNKMHFIMIVWSLARILSGILGVSTSSFYIKTIISQIYNTDSNIIKSIIYLAGYCIFTEFLPCLFSLIVDLVATYESTKNNKKKLLEVLFDKENQEIIIDNRDDTNIEKRADTMNNYTLVTHDFILKLKDFTISSNIASKAKHSLGYISKGLFKGKVITIRTIEFDRLSRYNLEEIGEDIDEIITLQNQYLNRVIGVCFESSPIVHILYASDQIENLDSILHSSNINIKKILTIEQKITLSIKICAGIKYLHDNNIAHLHLSSKNILIDSKLNPKITDFGFRKLKELASIFLKYKNKNSYSSPEVLSTKSHISNSIISNIEKHLSHEYGIYLCAINGNGRVSEKKSNSHKEKDKEDNMEINSVEESTELPFNIPIKHTTRKNNNLSKADFFLNYDTNKVLFSIDVYSFGLILWEIFSEVHPFNIPLKEIYKFVVEQNLRPEISEKIPKKIAGLIKKCWNKDNSLRFSIDGVLDELKQMN